ncbi:hypothetical protein [Vacuolonema iberomarrocanum]|uniref:hypothetical protein n=1 Tax=Vacuolonema iberomarrocanum TaxID=3454632 RepID=UPI0019E47D87|nr:hypothetical protein [filamentous cyanobacterium LEGE 07170]
MQVNFSEDLLLPTCQLQTIQARGYSGHICTEQKWQFSTEDWTFAGLSTPATEHQERFKSLVNRIFSLFKQSDQVNTSGS